MKTVKELKEDDVKLMIGEACTKLVKVIQGVEIIHEITITDFEWDVVNKGRAYKIYLEEIKTLKENKDENKN